MVYVKDNKKFIDGKIDDSLKLNFRLLPEINKSDIKEKLINYKKYVNTYTSRYKVEGEKKRVTFLLKIDDGLQKSFQGLDKLNININKFIKYLLEYDLKKFKNNILSKKTVRQDDSLDFNNPENQYITLNDLIDENKLSNTYKHFIMFNGFNKDFKSILLYKNKCLESLKKLAIENNLLMYGQYYKPSHIQTRIDLDKNSKQISLILDLYKKIIFYKRGKIITDNFRFELLKSYYELMFLKTIIISKELKSLNDYSLHDNFHINFDEYLSYLNKTFSKNDSVEVQHSRMIKYIDKNKIIYDISDFSYINKKEDKEENNILADYVPLPHNIKKSKYQSGYIYSKKPRKDNIIYYKDDTIINFQDYKENRKGYYTKIKDTKILNIFGDTETNSMFFKIINGKHIQITKDEYLKLLDENINFLKNLTEETKSKIDVYNDECILSNTSLIDLLVKHRIYMKTDLQTIQAYFFNSDNPSESIINIWVDSRNQKLYNNESLEYNFKQKIKDKETTHNVKANIIYSNNLTEDFITYSINWYDNNLDKSTNNCPQLTIWFHNLKFDLLSMGILEKFAFYELTLKNFNNTTPKFYMFEGREIEMKTKTVKPKILFLDSYNFSATSLKDMGVNVGIKKEVEKVDFSYNDNIFENSTQAIKLLQYSLMDVVILKEFICSLKDEILKFTDIKYGSAGTALSCFLTSFYDDSFWYQNKLTNEKLTSEDYNKLSKKDQIKYYRDNNRIHKHRNKYLETIELYAYIGGHTEVFNKIGLTRLIKSLDINSSYPASMLQKLPKKFLYSIVNPSIQKYKELSKQSNIYTISKVFIPYDNNFIVPIKNNMQIEYPVLNNVTTYLHEAELNYLLEYNKNIKIIETICYSASNKIFENYVIEWMFKKSFNKRKDINNPLMVALSKLFANSCYGKLGEKTRISDCRIMNKDDVDMVKMLLENRDKIKYSDEDIIKLNTYVDVPINCAIRHDDYNFSEKLFANKTFQELAENTNVIDQGTLRVNFIRGYMAYSKKISIPGNNSSFALVGAITAYSRVALLKCLKKLGVKNNTYCDTDSNYTKWTKEIELNINEIKPSEKDLKEMYQSKEDYKKILEKYEKLAMNDKINICESLVSKHYFWEYENKGNTYHIITRGNKDNVKMQDINLKDIFIIGKDGTREDFINNNSFKYCMDKNNIEKFSSCLKGKKYLCKMSEKLKGVPKNAILVNEDLYFYENWLSPNMQKIQFNSLDGQYISYLLKMQEKSRSNYPKALGKVTNKTKKKSIDMLQVKPIVIDFEIIEKKFELSNIITYSYYDYKITPFEIIQKDNELIYKHEIKGAISK